MIWIVFTLIKLSFIFLVYGLLSEFIDGVYLLLAWIVVSWANFRFSSGYPLARMAVLFAITLSHGCLIGFLLNVLIEKIELTFMTWFGGMIIGILCGMVVVIVISSHAKIFLLLRRMNTDKAGNKILENFYVPTYWQD